ncbi:MAG: AAA family ATPase [Bacteroidota bacterium]
MISEITINNFKSIVDLTLPLSNINVFIGENGCGKSNILEAVAFLSLIGSDISNEQLELKGVRTAKSSLIFNSFKNTKTQKSVAFNVKGFNREINYKISDQSENSVSPKWQALRNIVKAPFLLNVTTGRQKKDIWTDYPENSDIQGFIEKNGDLVDIHDSIDFNEKVKLIFNLISRTIIEEYLEKYLIYSPETLNLRGYQTESKKEPLGIYGENLDVLISSLSKDEFETLKSKSQMISWLEDLFVDSGDLLKMKGYKLGRSHSKLYFADKHMKKNNNVFSSENANEGILFFLFYFTLFLSKQTPNFFAIDDIEKSQNPKLCRTLIKTICEIAIENNKQALITTHHPAVLDGLNLNDDRQRLFVVKRNDEGHTVIERIKVKPTVNGESLKLSEMWMRGYLGAIPTNF